MSNNKPGNVFLYDSLDKQNADQKKPEQKQDTRNQAVFYMFLVFIVMLIFILYLLSFQWLQSFDDRVVVAGSIVFYAVTLSIALLAISSVALFIYSTFIKIQRDKLVNVMEHQTTINSLNGILTPYFDVAMHRADRSIFQGVQNLTYSPTSTKHVAGTEQTEIINPDVPLLESELPVLEEMQSSGVIGRSGNSILLGWSNE